MAALVGQALPPANREPVASFTHSCTLLVSLVRRNRIDRFRRPNRVPPVGLRRWRRYWCERHARLCDGRHVCGHLDRDRRRRCDPHGVGSGDRHRDRHAGPGHVPARSAGSDANTSSPGVTIPASVSTGDRLVMFITTNRAATATTPAGWTPLGSVSDGVDVRGWAFTKVAEPGDAGIVVRSTLDALSKTSMVLLAYRAPRRSTARPVPVEAGSSAPHAAPAAPGNVAANATVIWYWADKTSTVHGWTVHPALTTRASTVGSPSGMITRSPRTPSYPRVVPSGRFRRRPGWPRRRRSAGLSWCHLRQRDLISVHGRNPGRWVRARRGSGCKCGRCRRGRRLHGSTR